MHHLLPDAVFGLDGLSCRTCEIDSFHSEQDAGADLFGHAKVILSTPSGMPDPIYASGIPGVGSNAG